MIEGEAGIGSKFKYANELLLKKSYKEAARLYREIAIEYPELADLVHLNISIAERKCVHAKAPSNDDLYAHKLSMQDIFDEHWYVKQYNLAGDGDLSWLDFYNKEGWKLGQDPSPLFSMSSYLQSEPHFKDHFLKSDKSPLQHYCDVGYKEQRPIFETCMIDYQRRYVSSSSTECFSSVEDYRPTANVAVFVHCYYIDVAEVIIDQCLRLGLKVYASLVIGTDYFKLIRKYGHCIKYKIFENRGRDIAPFLTGFSEDIAKHEFCLHLHTKKSLHYGAERSDWMGYCLESLLGNIKLVMKLFDDQRVSIVFPEPPDFVKSQINWGHNFERTKRLMALLGERLEFDSKLDFPAGSMFWFRAKDLLPIFRLNISSYLFECEAGQVDGTLAHAIERLFGVYVLSQGKKLVPIRKEGSKYFNFQHEERKHVVGLMRLAGKSPERYALGLKHFYPELTPFTFKITDSRRKRLNLLVPTIDPKHVFGGISTAIKLFMELGDRLGCDMRIITTDDVADPSLIKSYPSYSCYSLQHCDDDDDRQILSGVPRCGGDLNIRQNDIFIATAWWTAFHMAEFESFQNASYMCHGKHIYLIQDYEPHFYGWGSKHVLAKSTYTSKFVKIFNTGILYNYFLSKGYVDAESYILKPELNGRLANHLKSLDGVKKEKTIVFYGRPSAHRNCFEILMEAMMILKENTACQDWRILSMGEMTEHPLLVENGIEVLGKMTIEQYSETLAKAFIGVSLMVSPHPSYPPLEFLAAGLHTYTNCYESKDYLNDSPLLCMGDGSPNDIARFIGLSISLYEEKSLYEYGPNVSYSLRDSGYKMDDLVDVIISEVF